MKVKSVEPGGVFVIPIVGGFGFWWKLNGKAVDEAESYPTANAAKQAMREKVAHERKRHGLEEIT